MHSELPYLSRSISPDSGQNVSQEQHWHVFWKQSAHHCDSLYSHLVNIAQVVVFFIYRFLYGLIPLFEISTCAYYPLLVS